MERKTPSRVTALPASAPGVPAVRATSLVGGYSGRPVLHGLSFEVAAVPLPLSGIPKLARAGSLLAIVSVPVCAPTAAGAYRIVIARDEFAASVKGVVSATTLKRVFELVTELTVSDAAPELRRVRATSLV